MKITVTLFISILIFVAIPFIGVAQNTGIHSFFRFNKLPLRASLDSLMKWYPEFIVYLDKDIEGKVVTGSCSDCSFEQALNMVLSGTSLMWIKLGNQVILKEREMQKTNRFAAISGTITDSLTNEWIVGANVSLQKSSDQINKITKRWCPTNAYGFFSLPRVQSGLYTLVIRALGYETVKRNIEIKSDESVQLDIGMVQKDIVLKEVTIEGSREALASADGFSRGVYIRSVPADQNQYLLDGGRIYNPAHFGGVLSTFNSETLNEVQVVLGGLPPSYGGRVGGIVALSLRDGTQQGLSGSVGIGSLGSNLSLEGPINSNTTFIVSGRRGYPDAAMQFLKKGVSPGHLGFSELSAKIRHRLSGNDQISLNGYFGRDSYNNEVEGKGDRLDNSFSWGNQMLNFRWIGIVSPSLFLYSSAVYSRYDFNLQHALTGNSSFSPSARFSSNYVIEDFSFRVHAENYYDEEHTVRAGVELIHHKMDANISEFSSQTSPFSLNGFSSWEASVYLQDQWRILPRVTAELGGRAISFMGDNGSFSAVDPRFSLLAFLDEQTRFYSSLSAINQFIHPYRKSGVFLLYPAIFWYPSTEEAKPSTSLHVTLGVERRVMDDAYVVSAESYYRITNNLHEFGIDTISTVATDLSNMALFGKGRTFGLVCGLQKRTGDLTGSINYNLSWFLEEFAEINGGKEFSPPFDRRHELQIALKYTISENWMFGVLCFLTSGQSSLMALKVNQYRGYTGKDGIVPAWWSANDLSYNEFISINSNELPGFQRLELNSTNRFSLIGLQCQFSLRLLNSYGLVDPFVWNLQMTNIIRAKWNATMQKLNLFPLYPAMEFTVRF